MSDEKKPQTFNSATEELAALELSIKKAQLADLELQRQEREYNMKDLKQRLSEREVKELQKKEDREAQGRTFATQAAADAQRQRVCTHKKGGIVSPRDFKVLNTGGNGQQYAILKHQMINGDLWIRCLRCGKTWVPPMKEKFYFDAKGRQAPATGAQAGKFDAEKYNQAYVDYQQACAFETNNSTSASVQCRFSRYNEETDEWVDASQEYRKTVINTNLR
jgi:hypothetical protein